MEIDISEHQAAEIFMQLFNSAKPQGSSGICYRPEHKIDIDTSKTILDRYTKNNITQIGYYQGRFFNLKIEGNKLQCEHYDQANGGIGTAKKIIASIKQATTDTPEQCIRKNNPIKRTLSFPG